MIRTEIINGIDHVDEEIWNSLTANYPFTSTIWCKSSEIYHGVPHIYVLIRDDNDVVGGAIFQIHHQENIPTSSKFVYRAINYYLRKRPVLACRSPFETAYSGLFLVDDFPDKQSVLNALQDVSITLAQKYRASFILADYLNDTTLEYDWGKFNKIRDFTYQTNILKIEWSTYDEYLAYIRSVSKKRLKNIRYYTRQAEDLGIRVEFSKELTDLNQYVKLCESNVNYYGLIFDEADTRKFLGTVQNDLPTENKNWALVYKGDQLVACELLIFDEKHHICKPIFYGRDYSFDQVYFYLAYQDIRYAIEELEADLIDYGTHATDFKRRLGFEPPNRNHLVFYPYSLLAKILAKILMPFMDN